MERGALWALDLPSARQPPAGPSGERFAEVSAEETALLAAAMEVPPAEVAARFGRGCRALATWQGEELAAYCWLSTGRERIGELARDLVLPDGESYVWDCATLPRFRGRGLYTRLLRTIVGVLATERRRRVWIGASSTNQASNRAFTTAGFQPVVAVVALRLAGRGLIVRWRPAPGASPALVAAARRVLSP